MNSTNWAKIKSSQKALSLLVVNDQVRVQKQNLEGQSTWEYLGKITEIGKD